MKHWKLKRKKNHQVRSQLHIYIMKALKQINVEALYGAFSVTGILIIIFIIAAIEEICSIYFINNHVFDQRSYILFSIALFSKIILKDNIFKHQILSLFIAFIGFILLINPVALEIEASDILDNILIFFISILYRLFFVLIKHLTYYYYILFIESFPSYNP